MFPVSNDGETWYLPTKEQFIELIESNAVNVWIDMSDENRQWHITIDQYRKCKDVTPHDWSELPPTLYGIPVVWSKE